MSPTAKTLNNVLQENKNFCCMCLQDDNENGLKCFDEEVPILGDNTKSLAHIISTVCGEEVTETFPFGSICEKCITTATSSYQFVEMCKLSFKTLTKTIDCILESTSYIDKDYLLQYNSLFINIDSNYGSQLCYDVESSTKSEAIGRFQYLIEDVKIASPESNETVKTCKSKRTRSKFYYDIPSIPTTEICNENSNQYKCKYYALCRKSYKEEEKLRMHYFKKHHPKEFQCNHCLKEFLTKEHLLIHIDQYHARTMCSQCGKGFSNKYVLQKHEAYHNFSIQCEQCKRVYRSYEAFNKHKKDNICSQKERKTSSQGTFFCHYCHKSYCQKPYLARHIKYEHENAVGFLCKYCDKQFYCQSGLEAHLVKHTMNKKFECSMCGKRFGSKMSLLYHTRLHTGEKPYKCEHCDQAFISASRRLAHIKSQHLPASFVCNFCNAKFKSTLTLTRHKKNCKPNSEV